MERKNTCKREKKENYLPPMFFTKQSRRMKERKIKLSRSVDAFSRTTKFITVRVKMKDEVEVTGRQHYFSRAFPM